MAFFEINPERGTLHGLFSRDWPPVLTIESGDTVRFRTLDAGWGLEQHPADGSQRKRFEARDPLHDGHALCGPVAVKGAEPGMTLEIQIGTLRPGVWGYVPVGGWDSPVNRRLRLADVGTETYRWTLDTEVGTATDEAGRQVRLRPFLGVMGMPPNEPGIHSTVPPRVTGGNLDCKELVEGSSLFLPIAVRGGLFSLGDGHAAQGDGGVCGNAIECPMEQVDLRFVLHPEMRIETPRAHTPAGWLTLGVGADLNEAMGMALDAMLGLMGDLHGLGRQEALGLASVVVDLRVTQVVNGVVGVHAVLPHGAIRAPASKV